MIVKELLELYYSGVAFSYLSDLGVDGGNDASSYPHGLSAYRIYNDATWPNLYGSVITMNMAGARFSQIFVEKGNARIFYRGLDGNGPALLPWRLVYDTEGWIPISLVNPWINYSSTFNSAAYRKETDSVVRLRGLIRNGTGEVGYLGVGYRPLSHLYAVTVSDNAFISVSVSPAGRIYAFTSGQTWVSLEDITFSTT